jgi:hypothetical protein
MLGASSYYQVYPHVPHAWLYIAIDARDLSICKVGITTMETADLRVSGRSTENPFYCLFNSYNLGAIGISRKELLDFERYMHRKFADRISFVGTDIKSEWLNVSPFEAEGQIEHYIANAFSRDDLKLMDEDGEIVRAEFEKFVQRNRPHPALVENNHLHMLLRPYLNYLCRWHGIPFTY